MSMLHVAQPVAAQSAIAQGGLKAHLATLFQPSLSGDNRQHVESGAAEDIMALASKALTESGNEQLRDAGHILLTSPALRKEMGATILAEFLKLRSDIVLTTAAPALNGASTTKKRKADK